ncbi:MAG: endonuclease III [Candidatus Parvarchaeota archaeon]|nr:endonuclease III [Candidatus Parvarchaeota archaeon]MCW1301658.1 endonuclease III [Candidatus Parvarchaeota archaeon]
MPPSYRSDPRDKIIIVSKFLEDRYGKVKFKTEDPFDVLIRTIISQRNKDEMTDKTFKRMSSELRSIDDYLSVDSRRLANLIKPSGFYNQKAKMIKKAVKIIKDRYGGELPRTREELMALPGVGGKTADIVLSYGFGENVIACDTHVIWISNAIGLVDSKDPEKVRERLMEITPERYKRMLNIEMVEFGKEICRTSRPKCSVCGLKYICNYYNKVYKKRYER